MFHLISSVDNALRLRGGSEVASLIAILLDRTARTGERDDAAIYLGRSNDHTALVALLRVASDPSDDELVVASCGESLAQIFVRTGRPDPALLGKLTPVALSEVIPWVRRVRPDLLPEDALQETATRDQAQQRVARPKRPALIKVRAFNGQRGLVVMWAGSAKRARVHGDVRGCAKLLACLDLRSPLR
jgi:hypothetical protein